MADENVTAPILNVAGDVVAIGPRQPEHVALVNRWLNDFEVAYSVEDALWPLVYETQQRRHREGGEARDVVRFTIYDRASLQPIGVTNLVDIDGENRTAEFGILIGEKAFWRRGYGGETARLVLEYGFVALGLHNIMLSVYEYNEPGMRAYRRAGFREFGRWRGGHRFAGRHVDLVFMECLATEFEPSALRSLLPPSGAP